MKTQKVEFTSTNIRKKHKKGMEAIQVIVILLIGFILIAIIVGMVMVFAKKNVEKSKKVGEKIDKGLDELTDLVNETG